MLEQGIKPKDVVKAIGATGETLRLWKKKAKKAKGKIDQAKEDIIAGRAPCLSPGGLSKVE